MTELVGLTQLVDQAEHDSWAPTDLNDLPEVPPVQPQLGDTHLVYPGKRHVFSGPPESAKTLAAYCVLIQVVRQGGRAILIDFEMGAYDTRQRLRELGATPLEISQIAYLEPDEPATPSRIGLLVATEPDLVVIDASAGIYSLEGLDDNKRGDVEKVAALYVKLFWRHEIATILIDHVVKDGEARGRYAIGSERKLGGADVHLGFDTVRPISRGTAGQYKIVTHKDRGGYLKRGHLADLHLESDQQTHNIAWRFCEPIVTTDEQGQMRRTIYMERISLKLQLADEALAVNEIKRRVKGNSSYSSEAIETLVHEGYATISEGPNRSKLVTLDRPYTQAEDPLLETNGQPGDSAVPVWFSSDSGTTGASGGSVVPGAISPEPPEPLATATETTPETNGWFRHNGNLIDSDLAWLESIAPDPDPQADPNP